ncbi:hypothetical protein VCSRO105_0643 [Vibrio cholerae]|nr:hypothetical protein DN30_1213 [Vibrio cholerae]GHW90082.1 hypothetical protein VCSRO105_0643 [Vibrio cholerae]
MISTCSGCQRRREWLLKWGKIANERIKKVIADRKDKPEPEIRTNERNS